MKRREFLAAASSMMVPVMVDGFGVKSLASNSALVRSLRQTVAASSDRTLVIVYLNGGNDGLNTVVPRQYYDQYMGLRSNIAIPSNQILTLDGDDTIGFHPAMTGMRNMYNEGKLAVIHSVSYPNPSQSHSRSSDIYMTGVDFNRFSPTGWAGRYLADRFPGYPESYPTDEMEDPLAIQIGYMGTPTLIGGPQSMQITIQNPASFYQLVGTDYYTAGEYLPPYDAGGLISYVRQQQVLAIGYGGEIKAAAEAGTNMGAYPPTSAGNELAEQLKIVARLIHGGLKAKIYYVELGGFDTHSTQVGSSTTEGVHAQLLKKLSDAIAAFQNDLKLQNIEDKVIGMTFSDFGRRATSNASKGTDHGVAAPTFVFGTGVKRRVIGQTPNLITDLLPPVAPAWDQNQDIKMQIDFRRIYADILNDWFGTVSSKTDNILFKNFQTTSLFSDTVQTLKSGPWNNPEVWSNGRVPAPNELTRVARNHVVEVADNISVKNIQVDGGGELKFVGNVGVTSP